jgi:3-oxoacyl-[acyl-carrier protein] reductase
MDLKLEGKSAIITGASRGLGFAVAKILASEGVNLVLNARNAASLEESAQKLRVAHTVEVFPVAGDITDRAMPAQLMDSVKSRLGGLDLLVTNAGGPPAGSFESFSDSDWEKAVELSFLCHVRLIRAAIPLLKLSPVASILTITSFSVKQPLPNLILSNSIRSATVGLTKSLSQELGPAGIRVNSILPAWTKTERVQELMNARAKANQTSVEEEITKLTHESSLGRLASPEEFANVAVFLLSPAASFLTGVMLSVDGGFYRGIY